MEVVITGDTKMPLTRTRAKELGLLIAHARAKAGLSTRVLAGRLHISNAYVSRLESGEYLDPSPAVLTKLAEALDIEPGRLDRIMRGAIADGLPDMRMYFRAKYDLTSSDIERIAKYMSRYVDGGGA